MHSTFASAALLGLSGMALALPYQSSVDSSVQTSSTISLDSTSTASVGRDTTSAASVSADSTSTASMGQDTTSTASVSDDSTSTGVSSDSSSSATFTLINPSSTHLMTTAAPTSSASGVAPSAVSSTVIGNQSVFVFPLSDGFPDNADVHGIQQIAGGSLPNGPAPPPGSISDDALVSLELIAFNELFEVAFFTELIANITAGNVDGFMDSDIPNKDEVLAVLKVHQADEELHALNANDALKSQNRDPVEPCQYAFPVNSFNESIALAELFTNFVLSTLPDVQTDFAKSNDTGLIRGVGAVIGQEGEQNGFYRGLEGKGQAQLPFLTQGARDFAFSAIIQNFVVGTCDSVDRLQKDGLHLFGTLQILDDVSQLSIDEDVTLNFSAPISFATSNLNLPAGAQSLIDTTKDYSGLNITYLNQANIPITVPITVNELTASDVKFSAIFPANTNQTNGFTMVALTSAPPNGKNFGSPDEVDDATFAGPAPININ